MTFIESSITVQLEYKRYLNKFIYGRNKNINYFLYRQNWEKFFKSNQHLVNFRTFLGTKIGQIWLKSEQGKLYQGWQKS